MDVVYTTPEGKLWAGTRYDGAYHYDGGEWTPYTQANGLSDNSVKSIFWEGGFVWIKIRTGISRFDGQILCAYLLPQGLQGRSRMEKRAVSG